MKMDFFKLFGVYGLFKKVHKLRKFKNPNLDPSPKDSPSDSTSKLLSLLINGLSRAFPYAKSISVSHLAEKLNVLYTLVHTAPRPSTSIAVLQLLHKVHNQYEGLPDRYYSTLYRRLLTLGSTTSGGGMGAVAERQLLALLYRVLRHDQALVRVRAFVKRLLQLALVSSSTGFVYAALKLIETLARERSEEVIVRPPLVAEGSGEVNGHVSVGWDFKNSEIYKIPNFRPPLPTPTANTRHRPLNGSPHPWQMTLIMGVGTKRSTTRTCLWTRRPPSRLDYRHTVGGSTTPQPATSSLRPPKSLPLNTKHLPRQSSSLLVFGRTTTRR